MIRRNGTAKKKVRANSSASGGELRLFADWTEPADGPANMWRDQTLLKEVAAGAAPALRLYRWSRPTLTLGHGQTAGDTTDPEALANFGIPWVRRPTGGRALLHLPDELTYAFAAPRGWAPGVRTAYFQVMGSIWKALARFVRLDPPPAGALPRDTAAPRLPCHAVATGHEITARGHKLVAGAQRWRRGRLSPARFDPVDGGPRPHELGGRSAGRLPGGRDRSLRTRAFGSDECATLH